jgi:hypothetical protein
VLFQEIRRDGKRMLRIRRGLELPHLFAAYPELLPDPSDPEDADFDAMGGKIALRAARPAGPLVGSLYLCLQAPLFLRPFGGRALLAMRSSRFSTRGGPGRESAWDRRAAAFS